MVESSSSGLLSRRRSASRNSDSARNDTGLEHLMIAWHQTELGHPTEAWATQPCRFRAFAFRRWHAASRLMTSYDIVFLYDIVIPYDIVFLCHSERWRSVCDGERGTPGMCVAQMQMQGISAKHSNIVILSGARADA